MIHTGVSVGQVPHPRTPPQPSSIDPHTTPTISHVVGTQSVVVVVVVDGAVVVLADGPVVVVVDGAVVLAVVVGGVVVVEAGGMIGAGRPQDAGVGLTLDLHVLTSALRVVRHCFRQSFPVVPSAQLALQALNSDLSCLLHGFGQRAASAIEVIAIAMTIAITTRIQSPPSAAR